LNNHGAHNAPDGFIANRSEDCAGNWIKLLARQDGSFTIQNGRNQAAKVYR
jgi:hypothetical protein